MVSVRSVGYLCLYVTSSQRRCFRARIHTEGPRAAGISLGRDPELERARVVERASGEVGNGTPPILLPARSRPRLTTPPLDRCVPRQGGQQHAQSFCRGIVRLLLRKRRDNDEEPFDKEYILSSHKRGFEVQKD